MNPKWSTTNKNNVYSLSCPLLLDDQVFLKPLKKGDFLFPFSDIPNILALLKERLGLVQASVSWSSLGFGSVLGFGNGILALHRGHRPVLRPIHHGLPGMREGGPTPHSLIALQHCLGMPYWHDQLVLSLYLHQLQSHQLSFKKVCDLERSEPIDRTPGIPGSDKNLF